MFSRRLFVLSGACVLVSACGGENDTGAPAPPTPPPPPPPPPGTVIFNFSFADGLAGWEADYSDYRLGQEVSINFQFGFQRLPPNLNNLSGFFLSSDNRSDDVFMYIFRALDGLAPGSRWRVDFSLAIGTDAPSGCAGAGGAPGEAVVLKAGATNVRPAKVVDASSYVGVNFAKGNQSTGGANAVVIGNFAQDQPGGACLNGPYLRKTLTTAGAGPVVTADSTGRLWLVIGTDSGFEGFTRIFYLEGTATLTPA